ncbi:glycoprotein pentasaccharide biosynthesis putative isomerase AglQ [Haloferax denitrificans]|uniref:Agl cluster protein AglQ n=1 Tax=Haloferax denitrificans ATCC 35960 TaxID=662478 RepID=M0J0T1_9EURY|nr:glycoprotein pentasaccharide biosynthesis putative isomerase AglQ [Haloferax denitrificans]EMA01335.1 agl cluster protein AglQ [Haloferax denitrificans ATCC 35960]
MTSLSDILVSSAKAGLSLQRSDGSMPAGHNGPYHDPETPVRNTSHWLVTFLKVHELTDENRFRQAASDAVSYLLSDEARPHGHTFEHRQNDAKDRCNGLMGQAWSLEALALAARELNNERAAVVAADVFLSHPFCDKFKLWQRVDTDGTILGFDRTFNHQLWFAASGGLVAHTAPQEVSQRVRDFLDSLSSTIDLYENGLIRHPLRPSMDLSELAESVTHDVHRSMVRNHLLHYLRPPRSKRRLRNKAEGYHSFNLYALAILAREFPSHSVWSTDLLSDILEYTLSDEFREATTDNKFSHPYNPPGFEVPAAMETFSVGTHKEREMWVNEQIQHSFDPNDGLLTRGTDDTQTHAARLYEATRLDDYEIYLD